jgi:hypothetical protein
LQSESPDEAALVKAAAQLGCGFLRREPGAIYLRIGSGLGVGLGLEGDVSQRRVAKK